MKEKKHNSNDANEFVFDSGRARGHTDAETDDMVVEEEVDPVAALKKLREKLKKCVTEKQEYLDGWQRSKADFVNARRDEELRHTELIKFAEERVLQEIIPILDSFDMAIGNQAVWESVSKEWRVGIESIYKQLLAVLKTHQVLSFSPLGEPFNPSEHTAVDIVPTEKSEDDHVIAEVLQNGYRLNGKIIRPAQVKIFKHDK